MRVRTRIKTHSQRRALSKRFRVGTPARVHSESIRFDSEAWLEEIDGWSPSVESLGDPKLADHLH